MSETKNKPPIHIEEKHTRPSCLQYILIGIFLFVIMIAVLALLGPQIGNVFSRII